MNLLFIADPLESFAVYKDSTFAMMQEAQARGWRVSACEPQHMFWQRGGQQVEKVSADVRDIRLTGNNGKGERWFEQTGARRVALHTFDVVLMRKDPPFDSEYFYATHLLTQAEREGARVFNSPQALRNQPEKLSILEFPEYIAPTLVTRNPQHVRDFHAQYRDIICKPLDGMGGMGIFRVKDDGLNLGSIIESLNGGGSHTMMVQQFLPEIEQGDKRALIIGGEPVPYCLARIPQGGEVRGNLAAGGKGVAQPLTDADRAVAQAIGRVLAPRGLLLIGLDIIGTKVTEINVTSPTCFREIHDQAGCNVAALFMDALERALASPVPNPVVTSGDRIFS